MCTFITRYKPVHFTDVSQIDVLMVDETYTYFYLSFMLHTCDRHREYEQEQHGSDVSTI